MRLRRGDLVSVGCLPGEWVAVATVRNHPGWWEITPKTSTPGLVALARWCTMEVRREDMNPLPTQETLL